MVVCLTFDDGLRSHYEVVRPILTSAGMTGTFFINHEMMESRRWNTMTWSQANEMHGEFEIANHGKLHVSMPDMATGMDAQISSVPEALGIDMRSFCYPGYHYSLPVIRRLREHGYTHARAGCDRAKDFSEYQRGASGSPHHVVFDNPYSIQCLGIFGSEYGFEEFKQDVPRVGDLECGVFCFHEVDHALLSRCLDYLSKVGATAVKMCEVEEHFEYSIDNRHVRRFRRAAVDVR